MATQVVSTPQASAAVSDEDSFIWGTARGFHMLTHRAVATTHGWPPRPSTGCGGGHLFSEDLLTWFVGGNCYGRSANNSAQCDVQIGGQTQKLRLTSRQRPTVLVAADGRAFLYTGVSGPQANITEYEHSFTLVQEIDTKEKILQ